MNLFVIEIQAERAPARTRKLAVHADNLEKARQLVHRKYKKWAVRTSHEVVRPAAICFEEGWWE